MHVRFEHLRVGLGALMVSILVIASPWNALGQQAEVAEPAAPDGPRPIISVDDPVVDFGEHWASPTMEHTFRIRNTGDAPLEITQVRPTCGCTVARDYPRTIEPGQTGDFPFTLNVARYQGPYTKPIFVMSNDPDQPQIKLDMKGVAQQQIETQPRGAFFGVLQGNAPQTRTVTITNNTETPLKLEINPPSDPGPFRFELNETDPGKEFELKVTAVAPFGEVGLKRVNLPLATNLPEEPQKLLLVTGNVQPRISIRPPSIRIMEPQSAQPDGTAQRTPTTSRVRGLTLINNSADPVEITEVTTDDPALSVEYQRIGATRNYSVRLRWDEDYTVPSEGRTLTIKTDDEEFAELTVPILSVPQPARRTPPQRPQPQDARAARRDAQPQRPTELRPAEMMVGQKAPDFSLTTLDGEPVSNESLAGKVAVLNFFAPRCPFCRRQMPNFDKVRAAYVPKGVRFINVHQAMRQPPFTTEEVIDFFKELDIEPGELAMDDGNQVGKLFEATAYPTMIVLGKDGTIAAVNIGAVGNLETRAAAQLDAILADRPIPDQYLPPKDGVPPPARQLRPAERTVGQKAPDFALTTLDGEPVSNEALAGKVAVLNFFAPRCPFCRRQMPQADKIREAYVPKGVRFIHVHQAMRQPAFTTEQVIDFFKELEVEVGELAMDDGNQVGRLFQALSFPTMIVLGKDGTIAAVNVGALPDLEQRTGAQLDALLADRPIPDQYLPPKDAAPPPQRELRPAELRVGQPAPPFGLTMLDGSAVNNQTLADKVTVLNFFAPRCPFCIRQLPRVHKVRSAYSDKGVQFIEVHQAMRQPPFTVEQVIETFKNLGIQEAPLAMDDDNKVGRLFDALSFPTMVILDKNGTIAAVNAGNVSDLEARMEAQLDALLENKPVPPEYLPQKPAS
jgi:thiol-disulfide isomerase/thioredoxin